MVGQTGQWIIVGKITHLIFEQAPFGDILHRAMHLLDPPLRHLGLPLNMCYMHCFIRMH
jgi:hypothetical protein